MTILTTTFPLRGIKTFLAQAAFILLSLSLLELVPNPSVVLVEILVAFLLYLIFVKKLDYLDPLVVFSLPWLLILAFSLMPISEYAIPIHRNTDELILFVLFAAMLTCGAGDEGTKIFRWRSVTLPRKAGLALFTLDVLFFGLTLLNVLLAGYVPLIRGALTGDTGYLDFGIHGLYGFYLAFANAWGILHLVLYMRTRRVGYLFRFYAVILIFLLFVTRQNLISVLVEAMVVYSIVRKRIKMRTILVTLTVALTLFSFAGSLRSGGIKVLAKVRPRYYWVPDPVIWLYSYSYFNIANLDNLLRFSKAPLYNGSSVAQLVPSFLRPAYEDDQLVEVAIFNVASYLFPIYKDWGIPGSILLTVVALRITVSKKRGMDRELTLYNLGTFATLYFCAFFSFFVNFWFYLPIIFQIFFFRLFSNIADNAVAEYEQKAQSMQLVSGT